MSGEKGPVILSLLRNQEAGRVKVIISLIKTIIGLDKIKEEIKTFSEVISAFI